MALQNPRAVYNAANNAEAHLLCNALLDAGVGAFVTEDVSAVGASVLPEIHKPQIWVEREDAERARSILDQHQGSIVGRNGQPGPGGESESSIEVVCEDCGRLAAYPAAQAGSVQQCAHCGGFVDVWQDDQRPPRSLNPYQSPLGLGSAIAAGASAHLVSPTLYRSIALAALGCWLAFVAPSFGFVQFSEEMEIARSNNYWDAAAPQWASDVWWYSTNAALVIGLLGLMGFWRPARWMLLGSIVSNVVGLPFMGL
jgi:hypothetical protein